MGETFCLEMIEKNTPEIIKFMEKALKDRVATFNAISKVRCNNTINVGTKGHIDNQFITQEAIDNLCEAMRRYSDAIGRVPKIHITLNPKGESPMFKLWREAVAQGAVELVTSADKADTEVKLGKEWIIIDELSEYPPKQEPVVKPKPDYVKFHSRWGQ